MHTTYVKLIKLINHTYVFSMGAQFLRLNIVMVFSSFYECGCPVMIVHNSNLSKTFGQLHLQSQSCEEPNQTMATEVKISET